jgi:hypothetical protein
MKDNNPLSPQQMTYSATASVSDLVFKIPRFDEFCDLLHDRLQSLLYYMEELDTKFMLITNMYDRSGGQEGKGAKDPQRLVYAGTTRQRAILEKKDPDELIRRSKGDWIRKKWSKERDENWNALKGQILERGMKDIKTFEYFDSFRNGEMNMADIKADSLQNYFSGVTNVLKDNEKPIISDYFDIDRDFYIGIPLLGTGKFQGIVWVIFKSSEKERFEDPKFIKRVIKLFALIYNDLVMSWEVSEKESNFKDAIKDVDSKNPIQAEIHTVRFYEISEFYYQNRIRGNEAVIEDYERNAEESRRQLLRTAIITILLDSYAHNISAHSLTALAWWFRERAEYIHGDKDLLHELGRDTNPLIRHLTHTDKPQLAREMHPLFKFLLEKGAFWSGITRKTNFSGNISSLYDVLWFDFMLNPLYLGTIANTEEVLKLHIKICIYEREERHRKEDPFRNVKVIKKDNEGNLLEGVLATINLQDFEGNNADKNLSVFVQKGERHESLRKALENTKAFFPGGVVGKHALFTLLENEIRNVKHYSGDTLRDIQKNGLTLCISLHERPFDYENLGQHSLYETLKVGVWLDHPVDLTSDLLIKRIKDLDEDILTANGTQPRLGGSFQDKICASMLMTSSFDRVQDKLSKIGKTYYPWIKTASQKVDVLSDDRREFEMSFRRFKAIRDEDFQAEFGPEEGKGFLKKYFHLWRGGEVLSIKNNSNTNVEEIENQGRFRFLYLEPPAQGRKDEFKSKGVIRAINEGAKPQSAESAYRSWLRKWMKGRAPKDFVVDFIEGRTQIGRLTYQGDDVLFENYGQIREVDKIDAKYKQYQKIPQRSKLVIAHGAHLSIDPTNINYRTDGHLIKGFCKGRNLKDAVFSEKSEAFELLEVLTTRICVFDNRVFKRIVNVEEEGMNNASTGSRRKVLEEKLELYRQNLFIDMRGEDAKEWVEVQEKDFLNYHFLVIHLSFIESMQDKKGVKYSEERIKDFIDDQVLRGRPTTFVEDNFILVITTGRGRMLWWEKLKEDQSYSRFTTFRPIESILAAMEDALQVADDFNLKYNLTKLFFGS